MAVLIIIEIFTWLRECVNYSWLSTLSSFVIAKCFSFFACEFYFDEEKNWWKFTKSLFLTVPVVNERWGGKNRRKMLRANEPFIGEPFCTLSSFAHRIQAQRRLWAKSTHTHIHSRRNWLSNVEAKNIFLAIWKISCYASARVKESEREG